MENSIINHLFEFWEFIGKQGNFYHRDKGFEYTFPIKDSWPSKVFNIAPDIVHIETLCQKMKTGKIPNSLGIAGSNMLNKLLQQADLQQTTTVKGMYKNITKEQKPVDRYDNIIQVDTKEKSIQFAKISSESFGYTILPETIITLLDSNNRVKLFLGKIDEKYVSCGIIFLDKNNNSGIHMIGTLPKYRGKGLGREMTNKLLQEAFENQSKQVYLVASEAGEKIYSKIGFIGAGTLKSYVSTPS